MAFPTTPTDGQQYTTSLGTVYEYVSADDKWILSSNTIVGATGAQGPQGVTGAQGIDGVTGPQGPAGADGVTGVQGIDGDTGPQGATGIQGETGAQGQDGSYSPTFNTNSMNSDLNVDLSNGYYQTIDVQTGAGTLYVSGGETGVNYTLVLGYTNSVTPSGVTGIHFTDGASPEFSGSTSSHDILSISFDGNNYYGTVISNLKDL